MNYMYDEINDRKERIYARCSATLDNGEEGCDLQLDELENSFDELYDYYSNKIKKDYLLVDKITEDIIDYCYDDKPYPWLDESTKITKAKKLLRENGFCVFKKSKKHF